jgi:hypothetical protein
MCTEQINCDTVSKAGIQILKKNEPGCRIKSGITASKLCH